MTLTPLEGQPQGAVPPAGPAVDARARATLLDRIERSLLAGHVIPMPEREYCFRRRGDLITEGSDELEVLENGVYGRLVILTGKNLEIQRYTWGFFVDLGDARSFFAQCLDGMSPTDQAALMVRLAARATLAGMQPDRSNLPPVTADVAGDEPGEDCLGAASSDRPSMG